jgi:hypothetical protein
MKASSLDFAESIHMIWQRFEKIQRGISTGTIIEVDANEPPIVYLSWLARDAPLAFRCPDDANAQARSAILW